LVLAEVELPQVDQAVEIPAWCGLEITGESVWSNAVLAQHPLQSWPLEERIRHGLV
jgi:CYTH domain-containing protein